MYLSRLSPMDDKNISSFHAVNIMTSCALTLNWKCLHFDEIFITGCTGSCQNDNFQCSQWWKFCQNDYIFYSKCSSQSISMHDINIVSSEYSSPVQELPACYEMTWVALNYSDHKIKAFMHNAWTMHSINSEQMMGSLDQQRMYRFI